MDWTQYPPPDRYGITGLNYPTPCPTDFILIEEFPIRSQGYVSLPVGIPHKAQTDCRLTWQGPAQGNGPEKNIRRIWANPRLAQETYNLSHQDSEEKDLAFPTFMRSYLIPKVDYVARTPLTPLTAIIGLKLTVVGTTSLADGRYDLAFSGSGTGAAGIFHVVNGKVAYIALTNSGTGYTSAPTVTAPSTTGVTIVASIQPQTAVLTGESKGKAEEMLEGWFWRVNCVWETIPGPTTSTTRQDDDGAVVTISKTKKLIGNITPGETLVAGVWSKTTKQNAYALSEDGSRDTRSAAGNTLYAEEVVETRAVPGNVLTASFYDPQSDTIVTETRQLVAASSSAPSITSLFTDYRRHPNDNSHLTAWDVQRTYPAGITSKTIVEYEPDNYTYPAIMSGVSVESFTKLDGDVLLHVTPLVDAERPRPISKKITRTFTTTQPDEATILSGLYAILPIRHRFVGVFFKIETGPVLNDAESLIYTTASGDPTWGASVGEEYDLLATTPTATDYLVSRAAGQWKMVAPRNSKKLAAGLWELVTITIPIL